MEKSKKTDLVSCPICGSEEVSKEKYSKIAFAFTFLFFGFPIPYRSQRFHCFDCYNDFKIKVK